MIEAVATAFQEGGPFMYAITAALGLGLAVIGERLYYLLVRFNVDGRKFYGELKRLIQAGDLLAARDLCGNAPLPRILRVGIEAAVTGGGPGRERAIQNAVDEEALAVIPSVEKRIHYLSMIANVATLMGLLGTTRARAKRAGQWRFTRRTSGARLSRPWERGLTADRIHSSLHRVIRSGASTGSGEMWARLLGRGRIPSRTERGFELRWGCERRPVR